MGNRSVTCMSDRSGIENDTLRFERLEPLEHFERLGRFVPLEQSLFFQLSHEPIIDEIRPFKTADLFIGHAEETNGIVNAIDIRIDPALVNALHDLVSLLRLLRPHDLQPFCQGGNHRTFVGRTLDISDRFDHGANDFLHRDGRRIDKTAPRHDGRALVRDAEMDQIREDAEALSF
jgi:hypothetical protein